MSKCAFDKVDQLIHKIYKFMTSNDKHNVKLLIANETDIQFAMDKIAYLVNRYVKQLKLTRDDNRQDFIVSKIIRFLQSRVPSIMNASLVAADIGGGNGNVLSGINDVIQGDRNQFICVENISNNWVETYEFNRVNISYTFWDNTAMHIADNTCDVVLCMVSLHHMTDDIIAATLSEISRVLKSGGVLLVKEHDANTIHSKKLIDWEHHLYHILDCAYAGKQPHYELYKRTTNNFKPKEMWKKIIETYQFKFNVRTNRFLDGSYVAEDMKNITNLYWDMYTKL